MDITDWKDSFIKLTKTVTIDEAALVAASINPFCVNSSIEDAINGGFDNWPHAKMVARLLRDAVTAGDIAVDEASVDTKDGYNHLLRGDALRRHIASNPSHSIRDATFRGKEVWQWMIYHRVIDIKYSEEYNPSRDRIIAIMKAGEASKNANNHGGEQLQNLTNQVTELTERLRQAEAEIATLKAGIPRFRHMTPALRLVAEVQERYWGDTWEPNTIPKQYTILHELENIHGLSNAKAKNVEYVASPIDRVTGKNLCSSQIES